VTGGDASLDDRSTSFSCLAPIGDEVGDRADEEVVLLGEPLQLGEAGHGPVVVHHLGENAGRVRPASTARSTAASV
jgi:hypothetical protein